MAKTRAIRFTDQEERLIQRFLNENEVFDFSTLARTSILAFIKDPKLNLIAVESTDNRHVLKSGNNLRSTKRELKETHGQ